MVQQGQSQVHPAQLFWRARQMRRKELTGIFQSRQLLGRRLSKRQRTHIPGQQVRVFCYSGHKIKARHPSMLIRCKSMSSFGVGTTRSCFETAYEDKQLQAPSHTFKLSVQLGKARLPAHRETAAPRRSVENCATWRLVTVQPVSICHIPYHHRPRHQVFARFANNARHRAALPMAPWPVLAWRRHQGPGQHHIIAQHHLCEFLLHHHSWEL